jgi:hypothetical protein
MQAPTMKTHGRLAAFGALGVCVGAIALFGLFFAVSGTGPGSGVDFEHSLITRISVGVIIAAIVGAHYAFARQLFAYTKEQSNS